MLFDFFILAVIIGLIIWGLSFLPLPGPIQQLILVAGIIILVFAFFRDILGVDILGHIHGLRS